MPRAIDYFIGSQAFIAAARIGHLCVDEMQETESGREQATGRMLFANPKNNPHPRMSTLAYRITQVPIGTNITAASIEWEEAVELSADEALAAASPSKDRQSGIVTFVQDIYSSTNGPVLVTIVEKRAAVRGFSRTRLGAQRKKWGSCPAEKMAWPTVGSGRCHQARSLREPRPIRVSNPRRALCT